MEGESKKISFWTKFKISIFKLEEYGIFLTEEFYSACKYLFIIVLLISVIISAFITFDSFKMLNTFREYVVNELPEFTYKDGKLSFDEKVNAYDHDYEISFIADTSDDITDKNIQDYKNQIVDIGIILLKNKMVIVTDDIVTDSEYMNIANGYGITSLNKSELIEKISTSNIISVLLILAIINIPIIYIKNILIIISNIIVIAFLGWIAAKVCGIRFSNTTLFSLATYSNTLSIMLSAIYICINEFIRIEIPYFDMICLLISYIYMVAAIFMIKYDLVKQSQELKEIIDIHNENMRQEKLKELSNDKVEKDDKNTDEKNDEKDNEEKEIENREPDGSEI